MNKNLPCTMSRQSTRYLLVWLLFLVGFSSLPAPVHAETSDKPALKLFSWWHAPKKYVIVFATRAPKGKIRWQWDCAMKPTSRSKRKTPYRWKRSGEFETRQWGFNWRLSVVWVRDEYRGRCRVKVRFQSKVWDRVVTLQPYSQRKKQVKLDFLSVGLAKGHPRSVIALVQTPASQQVARWWLDCRYRRKRKGRIQRRRYVKQGRFTTGSWRFQSHWISLGRMSREKGSCRIRLVSGGRSRVWKTNSDGQSSQSKALTSDGCEMLSFSSRLSLQRNFGAPSWKCLAVRLRSGQSLTVRTSEGSWIRAVGSNGRSLEPVVSRSTLMKFRIPRSDLYRLRIHSKGRLQLSFVIK